MASHCRRHNPMHKEQDRLKGSIAISFKISLRGRAI
jgi:hypothetical protein